MKKALLLLTLSLFLHTLVSAQTFNNQWASRFQKVLDSVVTKNNIKGASLALFVPGQGIWNGVSGNSSIGIPITADMRFGIGSNTKLFIATVMAKLQEQAILSLDDHLYKWLPSIPYIDSTATIRQLLSHQTGFFDYLNDNIAIWNDSIWVDTTRFFTSKEILATIGAPHFVPGRGYSYSNTNYLLAGMIIEAATGKTWVQNIHDIIFNPLKLDSTFIGAFEPSNGPVAHEWVNNTLELVNSPMISEYSTASSAGAILSTAGEMVQWYSRLFGGDILSQASLTEISNFEPTSLYGLGLAQGDYKTPLDNVNYNHTGGMLGYISLMYYDVRTHAVLCLLTNGGVSDLNLLIGPLLNVFYGEYPKQVNDAGIISILDPIQNSCNITITPTVKLRNFGSNSISAVSIYYKIDDTAPINYNWTGSLLPGKSINVTLPTLNSFVGKHAFTAYTSGPNGNTEGYSFNDSAKSIFIIDKSNLPFASVNEDFESKLFPPEGWVKSSNSIFQWDRTILASLSGTSSMVRANYNDPFTAATYDIDLPNVNIDGMKIPKLSFDYAYTFYPGAYDSLRILISNDCGISWKSIFYKGGNSLQTVASMQTEFYPDVTNWKHVNISLSNFNGDVLIRFRGINGFGNNLYIDNINLDQSTATNLIVNEDSNIIVYPNPATETITIEGISLNELISIADISGKILWKEISNSNKETIDISQFPKGVYFLKTQMQVQKIIKI